MATFLDPNNVPELFLEQAKHMLDPLSNTSSRSITILRYRATFGINPIQTAKVWEHLLGMKIKKLMPKHLLWALSFLKLYSPEVVHCGMLGTSAKTFRKWVWIVLKALSSDSFYEKIVSVRINFFFFFFSSYH